MELKHGPYSPSRLDTAICGHSFYEQYVNPDREKAPDDLPQARGGATHEIFELVTRKMIDAGGPVSFNEQEVRKWVVEAINRNSAAYEDVGEILKMVQGYINRPPAVLTTDAELELKMAVKLQLDESGNVVTYEDSRILRQQQILDETGNPRCDVEGNVIYEERPVTRPRFVQCDWDDPQAFARGKADIMMISDDTTYAMFYDHKTQMNVEEADTDQMGFYAWVASLLYPFLSEVRTVLHFARFAKYSEPYVWNQEDLYAVEDRVLTQVAVIENRQTWDTYPHHKCQYCHIRTSCPRIAEFFTLDKDTGQYQVDFNNVKILGDTNKAVWMAGTINVLDEYLKVAKEELREHVKVSGGIAIPGKVYEFRADEKVNWNKVNKKLLAQYYEICEKHKIDPKWYMGMSQTFSKSIWFNKSPEFVTEVRELLPIKATAEFKGYKL